MTGDDFANKLAILRENLERLEAIPQSTYEEFANDFRNLDSARHRLQTSIQSLIDIGSRKLAALGLGPPRTSRDLLEHLEKAGRLPAGSTARFGPLFGFSNRVVHLYDRVDPRIVYRILTQGRADIAHLLDLLLAIPDH